MGNRGLICASPKRLLIARRRGGSGGSRCRRRLGIEMCFESFLDGDALELRLFFCLDVFDRLMLSEVF